MAKAADLIENVCLWEANYDQNRRAHPRISRRGLTAGSSPLAETITANRLVQIADLG